MQSPQTTVRRLDAISVSPLILDHCFASGIQPRNVLGYVVISWMTNTRHPSFRLFKIKEGIIGGVRLISVANSKLVINILISYCGGRDIHDLDKVRGNKVL